MIRHSRSQSSAPEYLSALRGVLEDRFSETDLRVLCFDLQLEYSDLEGATKSDKVISLLNHLRQRDRVPELLQLVRARRQDINWDAIGASVVRPSPGKGSIQTWFGSRMFVLLAVWALFSALILIVQLVLLSRRMPSVPRAPTAEADAKPILAGASPTVAAPAVPTADVPIATQLPTLQQCPLPPEPGFHAPCEENDSPEEARPLTLGDGYVAAPDDQDDWFYFELAPGESAVVRVLDYVADGQLGVYEYISGADPRLSLVGNDGSGLQTMEVKVERTSTHSEGPDPRRYYVSIYTTANCSHHRYSLIVLRTVGTD